jgi:hypothetical protein
MFSRSCSPRHARWPFWLLLAAWFCANSPQAAMFAVVNWIGESRHFTHQQRLVSDVAHLLGGVAKEKADVILAVETGLEHPQAPVVPRDAVLKKIDLSAPTEAGLQVVTRPTIALSLVAARLRTQHAPESLTDPPRAVV